MRVSDEYRTKCVKISSNINNISSVYGSLIGAMESAMLHD